MMKESIAAIAADRNPLSCGFLVIAMTAMMGFPAHAYDVSQVSDGGSIEGTVRYKGDVPTKKIIPSKNVETCGGPRDEPMIRVGADQAVESAVVYLVDVAKGKAWPESPNHPSLIM